MAQQVINEVTSHKHLGLVFSNDCNWHEHIDYIKTKARFRINIMRKLKFQLDRKSLETIFIFHSSGLFLNTQMSSGTTAPSTSPMNWKKIQNEAARIVTGATKLVSLQSLYIDTGWESLAARREKHKLILYYKMQNGLTPEYLSSLDSKVCFAQQF